MNSYDDKAIKGKQLQRLTEKEIYDRLKGSVPEAIAAFLCSQAARINALESAIAERNLGDVVAYSIDSQSLKVGGTDVKTKQAAKMNPSSSGSDISFVDSMTQNENGEVDATRKTVRSASTSQTGVVQLTDSHSSTSTSTAATPKNVKEAYDLASGKADPASVVDSATYDSSSHTIIFKHGSTQLFTLDAAAFVKDGMVDSVSISNGNLVITFNTDAGKQPISIPLTDIFNPNNYYTKSATDVLLALKVDSTDSRLLPNSDEFIATYSTTSPGTTMEELLEAYLAGKKISVLIGGDIGTDTYAMKVPLSYVRVQDGNIVGFFFETHVDPVRSTLLAGSMITYWRTSLGQSRGWGSTSGDVAYAVASSTAAVANAASDAVANSNLATMIAARMFANASNAESGALTALMAQLSKTLLGVTGGTEIVTSYPSDNGFDTQGHVNQPYRIKLSAIATYIASALVAGDSVATPPRVKVLDSPYYYQNGSDSSNVKMQLATASASTYYSLGNRQNTNTKWGLCNCPDVGSYVEIDFDISVILTTGDIQFSEIPYIMSFCATCHEDDGQAYTEIPSRDSYIFALANLTVGNISNALYSYAHVRMCGYIPNVSGITGKAIFVGGCVVNGITGTNIAAVEMRNVKVVAHTKTFELT